MFSDIAATDLCATAKILVRQLLIQIVIAHDTAFCGAVAGYRLDAVCPFWIHGWPSGPLHVVNFSCELWVDRVAIIFRSFLHHLCLFVLAVVLFIEPYAHSGSMGGPV